MVRAGIFIGVDRTGNLQKLNDAASGAARMHQWALSQGMGDGTHAKLITDQGGKKVTPDSIYDAIAEIVNGPGVDQLILYFAGHGVNINRGEHWLLSDAPVRSSAAIDVRGSVELARYCGIGHVVVISDACRVAPEGIQAQNVRGIDVFPNESASDRAKPVDQFFACLLGRTAAEIKDPNDAAGGFSALYTDAMLDALSGKSTDVLEPAGVAGDASYYVKPVKLQAYLEREIPLRVSRLKKEKKVNQNPDAILIAHTNWLAKVAGLPPGTEVDDALPLSFSPDVTMAVIRALSPSIDPPTAQIAKILAQGFGPDHFESQCGVKVRGDAIMSFSMNQGNAQLLGPDGDLLRVEPHGKPTSLLLRFREGKGTVIPALPGYIAALTFDEGELIDLAYEPSTNTGLWNDYVGRADALRALRADVAAATHHGRFRLDRSSDPLAFARKLQYAKGIDPGLAVYAAYAYHDLQQMDLIGEMSMYLKDSLKGFSFFDLALLSRRLVGKTIQRGLGIIPFIPMLSQAWPLLRAHRIQLPKQLDGIEGTLLSSTWSLFDARGVDMLENALMSGEVL